MKFLRALQCLLLSLFATSSLATANKKPLLGLVMIVKNEIRSRDKLATVLPFIDRYTILDTGSTDGTQAMIREVFANVPGELYEEPFIDFSTSRNRVLDLAGESTEFVIMLDGDQSLQGGDVLREFLEARRHDDDDVYLIRIQDEASEFSWFNTLVIRTSQKPRYTCRVHECVLYKKNPLTKIPEKVCIVHHTKDRDHSKSINRFKRDLALLFQDHMDSPSSSRTIFYLAETFECLGDYEQAMIWYGRCIALNGWREEMFEAKLRRAKLAAILNKPEHEIVGLFLEAYDFSPHRAEPLYELAQRYLNQKKFALAYLFALRASQLPFPEKDMFFVDTNVYRYKAFDILGTAAWYVGQFDVGREAVKKALQAKPRDPRLLKNLSFYDARKL